MSDVVETLLNKALSTNSEAEAIAAFLKARKKNAGKTRTSQDTPRETTVRWYAAYLVELRKVEAYRNVLNKKAHEYGLMQSQLEETQQELNNVKAKCTTYKSSFFALLFIATIVAYSLGVD